MTKKSPIEDKKEKDIILLRKTLLSIIKSGDGKTKKDVIEAAKLLARMHHALQIDKSITAKATAQQAQKIEVLTKEEDEEIKNLINA